MGSPRVLIVAYTFPPHGAIGTMRTLRLVRYLASQGCSVTVLTGAPETYVPGTPIESSLLDRVPPSVKVVRSRAFRPLAAIEDRLRTLLVSHSAAPGDVGPPSSRSASHARLPKDALRRTKRQLDDLLSIPDKENAWLASAVTRGLAEVSRSGTPDVLLSTAPPWSAQLVALALATRLRCPWVAEFRDPWARAPWREDRSRVVRWANQGLERLIVRRSQAVLFVTTANRDEFTEHYGTQAANRFHVIPNGCDPAEFEGIKAQRDSGLFVLLHSGSLYGGRNPISLCRVIARLIQSGALDRDAFRLRFLGAVNPAGIDLPAACEELGLRGVVEFPGRVPRKESIQQMVSASALLLLQPGHTVSIPGKAYEYLAAGRPILAMVEQGETANLIASSGMGRAVRAHDEAAIERALLDILATGAAPPVPAPRDLYDGWARASETTALLRSLVTDHRKQGSLELPVVSDKPDGRAGRSVEGIDEER